MTIYGWIFLVGSWGVILSLLVFCLFRTLRTRNGNGK